MFIGEVSKKTGLTIKAIRFYEEKGLIKSPKRNGRYRHFDDKDVELLLLIKEAKALGITLSRLKGVIVYENGSVDWLKIKNFLTEIRHEFLHQVESLQFTIAKIDECTAQIAHCEKT